VIVVPSLELSEDWSGGMNNLSQVDRIPEGQVRDLLNLDPVKGGGLQLRANKSNVAELVDVHGAIPYLDGFLIASQDQLIRFSAADGVAEVIGSFQASGGIVGATLNGDAFIASATDMYRVRGRELGPWGLPEIAVSVFIQSGLLPAGIYRVAVTAVDAFGAESGASPQIITVSSPSALQVEWVAPAGAVECRVYLSAANGETLYLQQSGAVSPMQLNGLRDDTARLLNGDLKMPRLPSAVVAYKGRLLLVCGKVLAITEPFAPHLASWSHGFVQYSTDIDMVAANDGGVFVAAGNETFFISALGTESQSQRKVLGIGAVRGSGEALPDGRVAWMTRYGQAFGSADGSISLPQKERYAPAVAQQAGTGLVENNGVHMLVTTMKGPVGPNALGVLDAFDLEIDQ
jgi:hypothetical protein